MAKSGDVFRSIRQAEDYLMASQEKTPVHERNRDFPGMALIELRDARNTLGQIQEDLEK